MISKKHLKAFLLRRKVGIANVYFKLIRSRTRWGLLNNGYPLTIEMMKEIIGQEK